MIVGPVIAPWPPGALKFQPPDTFAMIYDKLWPDGNPTTEIDQQTDNNK